MRDDLVLEYAQPVGSAMTHVRAGDFTKCGIRLVAGHYHSWVNHYEFVVWETVCPECAPSTPVTWRTLPPHTIYTYIV